jgi:ABC-type transporter Mla maintaining outer membrane lipid asymmetry ATPase subunit MlaF
MNQGKIVIEGTYSQLEASRDEFVAQFLHRSS